MKQAYLKYIAALLLFGSNGIVASRIALNSYEIVLLRTLLGSLFLLAIFLIRQETLSFHRHTKQFLFLCVSGMAMGGSWIFLYEAYVQVGVSIASLLYYCGPVFVMALSPILFREKLTPPKIIGFAFVLCGIFFVNENVLDVDNCTWGVLCAFLSAMMYTFMVIFNKKATDITGLENAMLQLFVSFLTVAIFIGAKQDFNIQIVPSSIIPIFVLGLFNTGVGCYFYFSSIGRLPIQTVAVCGYLEPLSAVLLSVVILQETMSPLQIAGAALIIGGAFLAECCNFRHDHG